IAMGSRRVTPTAPVVAAVVSEAMVAPTNTPCCQSRDWYTSGATRARRPPKIIAEMGMPSGSSQCAEIDGDCFAATVYRELGCAAGPILGFQASPLQLISSSCGTPLMPSHQGSRDVAVMATFVKIASCCNAVLTFGFVFAFVPGATPKKPASGLTARNEPSDAMCIQAISSPTVHTR